MLTTDPIYKKPLLPVITIRNTLNTSNLYTYSSFTGTAGIITTVFPLYCSVNLSKDTQGQFVIQFEDPNKAMESTVTVNSRVFIDCGKQSGTTTRLISGLVRNKGYSRGSNGKILYTITGSSTGIRLNEILRYVVSEASKTADGITPNTADATRKADTLLATNLAPLTTDGIISIANLAANSDVETFVANLSIEYGQLQDIVNYIESQSGGQVVVDTNDLVNFRFEIKNTFQGRGFTIKNSNANQGNDDADDTMYLRGKNWSYDDDFFIPDYSNKITAIMRGNPRPSSPLDLGFVSANSFTVQSTVEYAVKFRPPHTRFTPGDVYVVASQWSNGVANLLPVTVWLKICRDSGGVPVDVGGIMAVVELFPTNFQDPIPTVYTTETSVLINDEWFFNSTTSAAADFYLDTTKDYWLIFSNSNLGINANYRLSIGRNMNATVSPGIITHSANFSTAFNGGSGWVAAAAGNQFLPCFGIDRYRSAPFTIWDPKATQSIQSGITGGQYIESMITESAIEIKDRDTLAKYMTTQLYNKARPTTTYNFPNVMAPNIPPFPGDPIVISDTILGFSNIGNRVVLTECGDMTYQWGDMDRGGYTAPTMLSIQATAISPRYR
jgi:hypothetical protein